MSSQNTASRLQFITPSQGIGLTEYGLILGLVVIVAIPALMLMGNQTQNTLNQANDSTNQISQMVDVLNNPANNNLVPPTGGTTTPDSSTATSVIATSGGNSSNLTIGNTNLNFNFDAEGNIRFTTGTDANNTTSVEGSQVMKMVMAQMETLLSASTSTLTEDEKDLLKEQIKTMRNLSHKQEEVEKQYDNIQGNKGNNNTLKSIMEAVIKETNNLYENSQDFTQNPEVFNLSRLALTISTQNYLNNNNYLNHVQADSVKSDINLLNRELGSKYIITGVNTEANHKDTNHIADVLEGKN